MTLSANPLSLTFTPENWDQYQYVDVTGNGIMTISGDPELVNPVNIIIGNGGDESSSSDSSASSESSSSDSSVSSESSDSSVSSESSSSDSSESGSLTGFSFKVEPNNATYVMQLTNANNLVIDWGDGSSPDVYDGTVNPSHTYSSGIYTVQMTGECFSFTMGYNLVARIASVVTELLTPIGLDGIHDFNRTFYNCNRLTTIPEHLFDNYPFIGDFYHTFRFSSVSTIPSELFKYNVNVTHFSLTFANCAALQSIPSGLFDNNTNVDTFGGTFYRAGLRSIPAGLFDNNTKVIIFGGTFSGCLVLQSIPAGLFDNNIKVTDFNGTFSNCKISTIPFELFKYNINVTKFHGIFAACRSLETIPEHLFDNNIKVTDFGNAFYDCVSSTSFQSIPAGLFDNNTSVTDFSNTFDGCTKINTDVPDLWNTHSSADGTDCFKDDTNATNYASIPSDWK